MIEYDSGPGEIVTVRTRKRPGGFGFQGSSLMVAPPAGNGRSSAKCDRHRTCRKRPRRMSSSK